MAFHKNLITLSILAVVTPAVFADDTTTQQLETLTSQAHPLVQTAADFAVADQVIEQPWVLHWHTQSGFRELVVDAGLDVVAVFAPDGSPATEDAAEFAFVCAGRVDTSSRRSTSATP